MPRLLSLGVETVDLFAGLLQLDDGEPVAQLIGGDMRGLAQR